MVLFNAKRHSQAYLVNTSRKAFTSVAFSRCGRYVATGECGINPAIKVWELDTPNGNLESCNGGTVIAEFVDHKYAVTCVVSAKQPTFLPVFNCILRMSYRPFRPRASTWCRWAPNTT